MGKLVQLELDNFKSYKGHQVIGPFSSFTAIIGPTGAGKSNLMDAISFVLGVKGSILRSSHLSDLIYRPTTADRGAAKAKKASVCVVYRKADDTELRFMRTVHSNDTSEYKIDGKTVSFAQYSKVLADEKILVKARNFLVFQGDVDAVVAQSPMDLTRMIEQISGSEELEEEYKRLEAEKERTDTALTQQSRKKMANNNEEKQLLNQTAEAERFSAMQREKLDLERDLIMWRLYHLEARAKEQQAELEGLRKEFKKDDDTQKKLEADLDARRKEQGQLHKELLALEKSLKKKETEMDKQRPTMSAVKERLELSKKKLVAATTSESSLKQDTDRQSADVRDIEIQLADIAKSERMLEDLVKTRQGASGVQLSDADRAEYMQKKETVSGRTAEERQRVDESQRIQKTETDKKAILQETLDRLLQQRQKLAEDLKPLQARKEKAETYIRTTTEELAKHRSEVEAHRQETERLRKSKEELDQKSREVAARLMEAKADRSESFRDQKFTGALEALKTLFPGVHGRLDELCKPSNRKFDLAATIVLGSNMDAVVVETEKVARDCIGYMRDHLLCVATFLPLDTIRVKSVPDRLRTLHKGARPAIDTLTFDAKFRPALEYACGDTLVCDTLEIARSICYERDEKVKAVSLDGTLIHKSGMITGGVSGSQAKAKHWEEKELANLKKLRDELATEATEVDRALHKLDRKTGGEEQIKGLETRLASAKTDLAATAAKVTAIERESRSVETNIKNTQGEIDKLTTAMEPRQRQIDSLLSSVHRIEDEVFKAFCKRLKIPNIRAYDQEQFKLDQETKESRLKLNTQRSKLENTLKLERAHLDELKGRLAKAQASIAEETQAGSDLETELANLTAALEAMAAERKQLKARVERTKKEDEVKGAEVKEVKKSLDKHLQETAAHQKLITQREAELEKISAERHECLHRCKLEEIDLPLSQGSLADVTETDAPVTINYKGLASEYKKDGTAAMETTTQDAIRQLAAQIERMAPNMRAVDKLEDAKSRGKSIEDELHRARQEAQLALQRFTAVKNERSRLFFEALNHIADHIDDIYKKLTASPNFPSGGTASLTAENLTEPYKAGVKYLAMPPMKRYRAMEQLSGGERSVAALALLFAIHSFHPSPFFILDEVDAALDNANLGKMARYIREQAGESMQFIQISHKSLLYERAEALVGVYRDRDDESSRILTLDLTAYAQ